MNSLALFSIKVAMEKGRDERTSMKDEVIHLSHELGNDTGTD